MQSVSDSYDSSFLETALNEIFGNLLFIEKAQCGGIFPFSQGFT